ncbi:hypothetical protein GDO81_024139 [Engystomops pustulosus]|uniref:Uncharacterized protein n=1 Tax=Engystomops pustulosus TaxID=76066 RepID=A0AAV6Z229_ENGPU|nr:hypothetical protein GDO81_024139 [Engystomops pustulosus]
MKSLNRKILDPKKLRLNPQLFKSSPDKVLESYFTAKSIKFFIILDILEIQVSCGELCEAAWWSTQKEVSLLGWPRSTRGV